MSFWHLSQAKQDIALVDATSSADFSYQNLYSLVTDFEQTLNQFQQKTLGVILCRNSIDTLVAYLAALRAGHAIFLLDANLHPALLSQLLEVYQPDWLFAPNDVTQSFHGFQKQTEFLNSHCYIKQQHQAAHVKIYPDLAVLLSTSGSTGSPKVVRLSYQNLAANAQSIAEYLGLDHRQRPITTLPMHYSYGLSVINSHLLVGATLLLTEHSVSQREFWDFAKKQQATSLAGVPYIYQVLHRMKFETMDLPSLQILTQAGGCLVPNLVKHFAELASARAWKFFVMYGQTEATARISYVPSNRVKDKSESIGCAIPGGHLSLDPATAELIYQGPNVMLGYAACRADLAKGDELNGCLRTGDIAEQDAEGFFKIIGRSKRFLKLFGLRINLDEVERMLESEQQTTAAATGIDDKLQIFIEDASQMTRVKQEIVARYQLHPTAVEIHPIQQIPRSDRGKPDYAQLNQFNALAGV